VITAMTSGDLQLKDWLKVLRRELLMGLTLGAFLGLFGYVLVLIVVDGPSPVEKLVLPVTILLVVTCGTLAGGALPLIFRRMGLDPALMSNPFVAGLIDILGIIIYMTVCVLILRDLGARAG
jgi:magnesium transporter